MENDVLREGVLDCIRAIESGQRTADGRYIQYFTEGFLNNLKLLVEQPKPIIPNNATIQRTILYPPTLDWSWMFQRPQQILSQFAKAGWKVIYANKTQKPGTLPTQVMPNIEVHHDWEHLKRTIRHVDVLWVSWAYYHDLNIGAKVTVYDCLDDFPEWEKYEESMIRRSDIVFATSQALMDKQSKRHRNVIMVKNACDPTYIGSRAYPMPSEFIGLKRPIVGFIGALGNWVDNHLLGRIAYEGYSLVIIGPKFGKEPPARAKYLGVKNYGQLPCYYANIDIGVIPFVINRTSVAADPIKMYEYLAAGKPVVSTNLPECGHYPDVVLKSMDHNEFINNIRKAINIPNVSTLARGIAMSNTWESRFKIIEEEINKLL